MPTITTLMVPGMTCGHCVSSVTKEVTAVAGVERVSIELRKGAESEVTILSHEPIAAELLTEALDEAGYDFTTMDVQEDAVVSEYEKLAAERETQN